MIFRSLQPFAGQVRPKPAVVHLAGDFPDPVQPFKTSVIRTLIDLTKDEFDHRVISINRVSPSLPDLVGAVIGSRRLQVDCEPFRYGHALRYFALSRGLWHKTMLIQLGDVIADKLQASGQVPDLIVGHKLTIEGIAVRRVSQRLNIPYALSIQGNTDTRIASIRADLKSDLASVFHEAAVVFPFAPWALARIEMLLGKRHGPVQLLPCPTDLDEPLVPAPSGKGLVSVFHLRNYRGKNLANVVRAYRLLAARGATLPQLEVIGGGTGTELRACQDLARELPQITFAGNLDRSEVRRRLHHAKAMVLPSLRESFGLVFIEALFAGTPIIYPKHTAIDGYFDGCPFALGVEPRDPLAIANAVTLVTENESELKSSLAEWLRSSKAKQFTRSHISRVFAEQLTIAARETYPAA